MELGPTIRSMVKALKYLTTSLPTPESTYKTRNKVKVFTPGSMGQYMKAIGKTQVFMAWDKTRGKTVGNTTASGKKEK
jgi:hypothetical protein